ADARRPVPAERQIVLRRPRRADDLPDQRLLLVTHTRTDRQPIAESERVLYEEVAVVLLGLVRRDEVTAHDAVDLTEPGDLRKDLNLRARRRDLAVRRGERRARALVDVVVFDLLVQEPVAQLMAAEDRRRLRRVLAVGPRVPLLVKADAAGLDVRHDAEVGDVPAVVRGRLDDVVLRMRVGRLDDELRR